MRQFPSRFGRFLVCGAIVIGLAAVQALLAGWITNTSAFDSSTSKTVAAKCPAGKRVLGGGGTVAGGRGQVVLQQLQPVQTATDDRFVVNAREDETGYSSNWRLTAYALCADPLPGYAILPSTSGSRSSNSLQSTISFCVGQTQVGFGGRINGGAGQVHLTNLLRDSNGAVNFTVIAALEDADGFDGDWNVTAYAVCPNAPDNLTTASTTTQPSSVTSPPPSPVLHTPGFTVPGVS